MPYTGYHQKIYWVLCNFVKVIYTGPDFSTLGLQNCFLTSSFELRTQHINARVQLNLILGNACSLFSIIIFFKSGVNLTFQFDS